MTSFYLARRAVLGVIVAVMDHERSDRRLCLLDVPSRILKRGEIHEVILTDEEPGEERVVNRAAYVGFVEVTQGGLVIPGDELLIRHNSAGRLLGFDDTHMPNHLNLVIKAQNIASGAKLGIHLDDPVEFVSVQ